VVAVYRDVLRLLDVVDALEDGQPVADAADAHLLKIVMLQRDQGLPDNLVF